MILTQMVLGTAILLALLLLWWKFYGQYPLEERQRRRAAREAAWQAYEEQCREVERKGWQRLYCLDGRCQHPEHRAEWERRNPPPSTIRHIQVPTHDYVDGEF